ncbi:hypothetical protein EVAR_38146_1 [Eumeta japonica]|uniref:Histone-lysine N-methyltransferase SETMAR n=1 Tax=Eumeta variegata TaxID=151549 RepID=A0A4C1YMF9_EUMVA|nr:hypothetical protein EVAR_38146_1 [Eumeta japonica]
MHFCIDQALSQPRAPARPLARCKHERSDFYCQHLMRLKQEVKKKWPESINRKGVDFHHDNAGPHTSLATQQITREFVR